MFKTGELVKRKQVSLKSKAVCVVVDKDENNYTVYNNSLKCLQCIAIPVVEGLYHSVGEK
tara:strand:+ start:891 stop:1070 length:180 start_codon:yes stop_codon:yes gene_type:complete